MPSLRSRAIIWLVKHRHLCKGKLKPEIVDENFSVEAFRQDIDRVSAKMKLPKSVRSEPFSIHSRPAEWIIPETVVPNQVLLYIHGGGFISGSCVTHRMHVAKFAQGCQRKTLLFDYRLAPEHPFPAAVDDCVSAYQWLLEQGYAPQNIVFGGESAGATLTLSLLLALKQQDISLPKAAFAISPVTDFRCQTASFAYNAPNDVAPMNSWKIWTEYYIADNDPTNPLLSPQFGDFSGMPPLYICVGTHEIHLDDCRNLAQTAQQAGVTVTLQEWDQMIHAFPILAPLFPEAKQALAEICAFVQQQLNTTE